MKILLDGTKSSYQKGRLSEPEDVQKELYKGTIPKNLNVLNIHYIYVHIFICYMLNIHNTLCTYVCTYMYIYTDIYIIYKYTIKTRSREK